VSNFSLRVLKRNETEVEEEYCWAITRAAGRSYCGRSDSSILDFGFQLDSLAVDHTQAYTKFRLTFDFSGSNCCVNRGVSSSVANSDPEVKSSGKVYNVFTLPLRWI
jgi:hypothetical protein